MENLARSAGYRDPGRLTWAMEAEAVRDLAAGPVTAADGDLPVTRSLDAAGAPQVHVERAGRALKSIPSAAGKVPEIAELKERARLFSEAMRDLDLVVSVAHAGGVDPETTESSIEMRGRLVEETAPLLGLDNVEVTDHHARIRGRLGSYSVLLARDDRIQDPTILEQLT
jgi:hypothetical protein